MNFRDGALVIGLFLQMITLGLVIVNKIDHDDRWETMTNRAELVQGRHVMMLSRLDDIRNTVDAVLDGVGTRDDPVDGYNYNLMVYADSTYGTVADIKHIVDQL